MGILAEPAEMVMRLISQGKLRKGFSVCELGDQYLTFVSPHRLAAEWYRDLGCGKYVSVDANGRGTVNVDLNLKWRGPTGFDLVTDFGTTEHIFNQFEVWRTIHRLAKAGGYIAFDKPTQGYPEHGFYNVHETLIRDMADANEWHEVFFERGGTKRGALLRGIFRKAEDVSFAIPQQGRYRKALAAAERGRQA